MNTTFTMPLFIDTLQFSKRMQKAGMQQKVAEEFAEILRESQVRSLEDVASKQDLKNLEQKLEIKIDKIESKIDNLEHKLTLRLFLMLSAAVGAITFLDKVIS
jgi:hypothetical protein